MRRFFVTGLAAFAVLFSSAALALDTSKPLLCASMDVHECVDGSRCQEVLPEAVNAPTFFRLDLKKKHLIVRKDEAPNKAEVLKELDGRIVMQGIAEGAEMEKDGVAWTIMVEEDTARMVATASTRQAAIVIFGACTEN